MSSQEWMVPVGPFHIADAAAVTASGALTELTPTPQKQLLVPMLGQFGGKVIKYDAWGHYTTTGTQGTITFDLRIGPLGAIGSMTSIVASSALTWVASQTNRFWHIEGMVQVRTTGGSGTCVGTMDIGNVTSGSSDTPGAIAGTTAGGTAAIDTTVTRAIALGVTLSAASQSITCRGFNVFIGN